MSTFYSSDKEHHVSQRRVAAAVCLLLASLWWIGNLIRVEASSSRVWAILGLAGAVAGGCFILHGVVKGLARRIGIQAPLVFSHFLQGFLVFLAYLTAYLADPIWFLDTWRSLYFGYYIYDAAMILICWRRLFGSFRTFYTIHHVFSFTITGLWMAAGGVWLDYIILGVMLWLASDLWAYGLAMIRSTRGRQWSRLEIARLKLAVFWIERVHRGLAYVVPWIIADFHLSAFAILVLGTGLANDILDAGFQWRSIRRTRVRRRPLSPMKRLFYQPT